MITRQSTAAAIDFDGVAPTGVSVITNRREEFPIDAVHGGLFTLNPDYSHVVWQIRIEAPQATGYSIAVVSASGGSFTLASATGLASGASVCLPNLRLHLCGGDQLSVVTTGIGLGDPDGVICEIFHEVLGSMSSPY
jgi:hypothetical protein